MPVVLMWHGHVVSRHGRTIPISTRSELVLAEKDIAIPRRRVPRQSQQHIIMKDTSQRRRVQHPGGFSALTGALIAAGLLTPAAHAQVQTAGTLFVNIDATSSAEGTLKSIKNAGTLGGFFVATGDAAATPKVATVGGTKGIQFDGTDYMQLADSAAGASLILAPDAITGEDPTHSIEVWALNPQVGGEETMVSWGHRGGGPDGSNVSFGYGSDFRWGAVGHWGSPDLGWNSDGGNPPANKWHHLVYTYDGTTSRVYSDGKLANAEILGAGVVNTFTGTAINLATQLDADGTTPTGGLRGSLALGRVRIHDGVLTDAQVAANYNLEKAAFIDPAAPPEIQPERLAKGPVHRYTFSETSVADATGLKIKDSVGTADGKVLGAGAAFTGSRLKLAGGPSAEAAYADLPNGLVSVNGVANGGTGEFAFETWIKVTGGRNWSRVFDFGSSGTDGEVTGPGGGGTGLDYLIYSAQIGDDVNSRRLEVRNADPEDKGTVTADTGTGTFNTDTHVLVTWKESTGRVSLYENGKEVAGLTTPTKLSDLNDVNVWLGRSAWNGDQNTQGEYDEARFYDYVLTPGQALGNAGAGPDLINDHDVAATISAPPADQSIPETLPAVFRVAAKGSSPIAYQWNRDGKPISDATGPSYTIPAVSAADDGAAFTVEVSNTVAGKPVKVVSAAAKLKVVSDTVTLKNRYSFSEAAGATKVVDSVGGANGDILGSATLGGGQLALDGIEGNYVNLPNGIITALGDNGTIEAWATYAGGGNWSRMFDFGTKDDGEDGGGNGIDYLFFTPKSGDGIPRFVANFPAGGDTTVLSQPGSTPINKPFQLTITYSFTGNTTRLYTNGVLLATAPATKPLAALVGADNNNWLGRSQFTSDPNFAGKFDEFRLYKGAMTPAQVAASAAVGPDALPAAGPSVSTTLPAGLSGSPLANAVVDTAKKTITADLPAGGAQSFLTITPAVNVKSVAIANGKLVITYQ